MNEEQKREAIYTADCALALMRMAGQKPSGKDAALQRFDCDGALSGHHFYVFWQNLGDRQRVVICQDDHREATEEEEEECNPLLFVEFILAETTSKTWYPTVH